jgi:hypothetical protein
MYDEGTAENLSERRTAAQIDRPLLQHYIFGAVTAVGYALLSVPYCSQAEIFGMLLGSTCSAFLIPKLTFKFPKFGKY